MSRICPVCNGLRSLQMACPNCGVIMDDGGKLEDFFDDYSPYLEMRWNREVNGYPDLAAHRCLHYAQCPECHSEEIIGVEEIYFAD